ncbi:MAG: hypothetical protein C4342_00195 [Armatimonadota bacterium]
MSYWLQKMLRLGLVEKVQVEKRGKHDVSLYRASAEVFTIPLERVPVGSDEEILILNSRDFERIERRSILRLTSNNAGGWYIRFSRGDETSRLELFPRSGQSVEPRVLNKWGCLSLTEPQARALRAEIAALLERGDGRGQGLLVQVPARRGLPGLAPAPGVRMNRSDRLFAIPSRARPIGPRRPAARAGRGAQPALDAGLRAGPASSSASR